MSRTALRVPLNGVLPALFSVVIMAGFVAAMLRASGAVLTMASVLGILYGSAVIVVSGLLIVYWSVGATRVPRLALAIPLGSLAASLFLVAGCFLTGRRAGAVFLCWSVLVVVGWRVRRSASSLIDTTLGELISIVVIESIVAFWCRNSAALLPAIQATGIVPVWTDYFIHGTQIAEFGAKLATGRSSFVLAGQPVTLYHFAPYMLPAALSSVVDLPAVALASSALFPYGILLMSLSVYALARALALPGSGLVAALALLAVPDVSTYGLRNGFFGFHWFLGASPGTGYAIATAFTALTLLALWRANERRECLWVAGLLTAAMIQVRAQLFLLFAPTLVATLLCETPRVRRYLSRAGVIVIVMLGGTLLAAGGMVAVVHGWLPFTAVGAFLDTVHTAQAPSAYDGVYRAIEGQYGLVVARVLGFVVLVPSVLGALTVLAPTTAAIAVLRTGWRSLDSFPALCLLAWLGLVLIAPAADYGDPTAYQYHSFTLVYATVFIWTLLMAQRVAAGAHTVTTPSEPSTVHLIVMNSLAAGLCAMVFANRAEDPTRPRMTWTQQFYGAPVEQGMLEVATYVRAKAKPGDIFALIPVDPSAVLDDAGTRFAALADVPAYLTRPGIFIVRPKLRAVVEQRLHEVRELESTTSARAAFDLVRRVGVTFLVALGSQVPRFDPNHTHASFRTDGAVVYYVPND